MIPDLFKRQFHTGDDAAECVFPPVISHQCDDNRQGVSILRPLFAPKFSRNRQFTTHVYKFISIITVMTT
jgi:hypothetical protein